MTYRIKGYSGRVIFDHLPKTAGQAVNHWLRGVLGDGAVTENLIGGHKQLISTYGGDYSVISGHVGFSGEGLDSRYAYVTFFRHPIDRAISWIYFVLNNHGDNDIKELRGGVRRFIDTDGEEGVEFVQPNLYLQHFCSVHGYSVTGDGSALNHALNVLDEYELWGLYERFPDFLEDFSAFLGVPPPEKLEAVNVTRERKKMEELSPALLQRLHSLNELDLDFYRCLQARYDRARLGWNRAPVSVSQWQRVEVKSPRREFSPDFALVAFEQYGGGNVEQNATLIFSLTFSLTQSVEALVCGIHIHDESGALAFGTNSSLRSVRIGPLAPGTHQVQHAVVAALPEGGYRVGFAFTENCASGERVLAWMDKMDYFRVNATHVFPGIGYVSLPAVIAHRELDARIIGKPQDVRGWCRLIDPPQTVAAGEKWEQTAELANVSGQSWYALAFHPLNFSYHWFDESGQVAIFEGIRSSIPDNEVTMGQSKVICFWVEAPKSTGRYRLMATPISEGNFWFDEVGFSAAETWIDVV